MTLDIGVATIGMLASVAAACLWFWASVVVVPDNIHTIVHELQRISRINALAAFATLIAALCVAYGFWRQLG
jgi:hypothetical protein